MKKRITMFTIFSLFFGTLVLSSIDYAEKDRGLSYMHGKKNGSQSYNKGLGISHDWVNIGF